MGDYYLETWYMRIVLRVAERLKNGIFANGGLSAHTSKKKKDLGN